MIKRIGLALLLLASTPALADFDFTTGPTIYRVLSRDGRAVEQAEVTLTISVVKQGFGGCGQFGKYPGFCARRRNVLTQKQHTDYNGEILFEARDFRSSRDGSYGPIVHFMAGAVRVPGCPLGRERLRVEVQDWDKCAAMIQGEETLSSPMPPLIECRLAMSADELAFAVEIHAAGCRTSKRN